MNSAPGSGEVVSGRSGLKLIPALDGVRGLAVLLVLLDHASDSGLRLFPGADFNRAGKYGVYLFFVLSAFLLTYPFFLRPARELFQARIWTSYALRRVLRILPLYLAVITYYCWSRDSFTLGEWWNHLLFRQGEGHFWTIPVEGKYYLALPLLVLATAGFWRLRGWKWGVGALAGFGIILFAVFFPLERAWTIDDDSLLSRCLWFFIAGSAAGMLHAWLVRTGYRPSWLPWVGETAAFLSLLAVILFIPGIFNVLFNSGRDIPRFTLMDEVCTALWPLFVLGVVHGRGWLRRVFENAVLRYLGWISYSAYLWHKEVLGEIDDLDALPPTVGLMIFVGAVVLAASISYWLIERPLSGIRLKPRPVIPAEAVPAPA